MSGSTDDDYIPDAEACYVVARFMGPFRSAQQTSARIRASDVAHVCANLAMTWPRAEIEVVRFFPRPNE